MTTAHTRLVALLGHPVVHSRSPALMTRAFADLGLDAVYTACDVAPDALHDAARGLFALGALGANVTVPHKVSIASACITLDDFARATGAVNTLVRREDGWLGANTDAPAVVRALEDAGVGVREARVVVLGAGGAARGAVVGLARAGARSIAVVARRGEAAREVAACVDAIGVAMDAADAHGLVARADLVVQATRVGMHGTADASDALLALLACARRDAAAMDLVYAPRETPFLTAARARGMTAVDGLGMLAHQAALAVQAWFGTGASAARFRRFLDAVDETG